MGIQVEKIFCSVITCPVCNYSRHEEVPSNACTWFYKCENCQTLLKPNAGDCCVFCSYGSVRCPSGHRVDK